MLKLPAFRQYDDVTVFQDHAEFWRFYLIPGYPTVRLDADGKPVFLLVKYAFSDQSREADPTLPRGGGYLVFDAELRVPEARRKEIATELQAWVDDEWERRKNQDVETVKKLTTQAQLKTPVGPIWRRNADGGSNAGFTGRGGPLVHDELEGGGPSARLDLPTHADGTPLEGDAPAVLFGEPMWLGGKVRMEAPQAAGLVRARVAERPASAIGNNVAAFSMDLTEDGATFMERTLLGTGNGAATDLSPIQVTYELKLAARLPPARVRIRFSTASLYSQIHELFHEHDSDCTDDYFTSESLLTTAIQGGLITVQIDAGGITDEDVIQTLQQQANSTVTKLLTDIFAKKERAPASEWGDEVADSGDEIYRLKQETEISMVDFEQVIELSTNVEHTIAPQGTLQTFLSRVEDTSRYVRRVDLDDDFFKTLDLSVRPFANFAKDDIAVVEAEVRYRHGGETKTQTFTFTAADTDPKRWNPSLIGNARTYEYRWRVGFNGRALPAYTEADWQETSTRNLNHVVETPGRLSVEVSGVGLDFATVLDAVLVELKYADPAHDVAPIAHAVVLTDAVRSATWERLLYAPWAKPVDYRVGYLLKTGSLLWTDWTTPEGTTGKIVLTRPPVDVMEVTLLPAGNWRDVEQAVVSVRYTDPTDPSYDLSVVQAFKGIGEFRKVEFLLKNPTARAFQWSAVASYKTPRDAWKLEGQEAEGDQVLEISPAVPKALDLTILGLQVDFSVVSIVKVSLARGEPGSDDEVTGTLTLTAATDTPRWTVPLPEGGDDRYRYRFTWYTKNGETIEGEWKVSRDTTLIVEPWRTRKTGGRISAAKVDFTRVYAVEVDLRYVDEARGVEEGETLLFTAAGEQEWKLVIPEDAPRAFSVEATYHLPDGKTVVLPRVETERALVLLPAFPEATPE